MSRSPLFVVLALLAAAPPTLADDMDRRMALATEVVALMNIGPAVIPIRERLVDMANHRAMTVPAGLADCRHIATVIADYQQAVADATAGLTGAALRGDVARIYADTFSADELAELAGFYRSPTGQKMLARWPELAQRLNDHTETLVETTTDRIDTLASHHNAQIGHALTQCALGATDD